MKATAMQVTQLWDEAVSLAPRVVTEEVWKLLFEHEFSSSIDHDHAEFVTGSNMVRFCLAQKYSLLSAGAHRLVERLKLEAKVARAQVFNDLRSGHAAINTKMTVDELNARADKDQRFTAAAAKLAEAEALLLVAQDVKTVLHAALLAEQSTEIVDPLEAGREGDQ